MRTRARPGRTPRQIRLYSRREPSSSYVEAVPHEPTAHAMYGIAQAQVAGLKDFAPEAELEALRAAGLRGITAFAPNVSPRSVSRSGASSRPRVISTAPANV